jgi:TfoX/Sxy family transcriptional regulator of competence genes
MAYSKSLAARISLIVGSRRGVTEKKMFGGVCFLLHGSMLVGVWQNSLIARLGVEQAADALEQEFVREFDITGRPMKGWAVIEPDGIDTDEQLRGWIEMSVDFVSTLPPK